MKGFRGLSVEGLAMMSIFLCMFVVIMIYLLLNKDADDMDDIGTAINSVHSANPAAEAERIFSSRASLRSKHSVPDTAEFQQGKSLSAVQINKSIIQSAPVLQKSDQLRIEHSKLIHSN